MINVDILYFLSSLFIIDKLKYEIVVICYINEELLILLAQHCNVILH